MIGSPRRRAWGLGCPAARAARGHVAPGAAAPSSACFLGGLGTPRGCIIALSENPFCGPPQTEHPLSQSLNDITRPALPYLSNHARAHSHVKCANRHCKFATHNSTRAALRERISQLRLHTQNDAAAAPNPRVLSIGQSHDDRSVVQKESKSPRQRGPHRGVRRQSRAPALLPRPGLGDTQYCGTEPLPLLVGELGGFGRDAALKVRF